MKGILISVFYFLIDKKKQVWHKSCRNVVGSVLLVIRNEASVQTIGQWYLTKWNMKNIYLSVFSSKQSSGKISKSKLKLS